MTNKCSLCGKKIESEDVWVYGRHPGIPKSIKQFWHIECYNQATWNFNIHAKDIFKIQKL